MPCSGCCKIEIRKNTGEIVGSREIAEGRYREIVSRIIVTCATDGNYGRSVAWGTQTFDCHSVIYVHETVSEGWRNAIVRFGADVRRVSGTYDEAVRQAAADAAAQ